MGQARSAGVEKREDQGGRDLEVSNGEGGREGGKGVTGVLAAEGELREGHGLVGETLRGQHGEGVTCRGKHCTLD